MFIFFGVAKSGEASVLVDSFMFSPVDRHAIITGSSRSSTERQKPAQRGDTGDAGKSGALFVGN